MVDSSIFTRERNKKSENNQNMFWTAQDPQCVVSLTCYGYPSGTRVWLSTWKVERTLWQHTIKRFPLNKYDSIEWQLYEYASSGKWGLDLYSSGAMPVYWLSFVVDSLSDRILPWCQGKFPNYLLGCCRSSEREGDLLTANFSTLKKV